MMKHSTLIRNKGSVIFYHKGGGEHKIVGDKKFSLKREEQRIFQVLSFTCIEICSKTLLPEHLYCHEKFSCHFAAKNFQYFL